MDATPAFRRIDPAHAPAIFVRADLRPARTGRYVRDGCGCIVGALARDEMGDDADPSEWARIVGPRNGWDWNYIGGLIVGWDDGDAATEGDLPQRVMVPFEAGINDGRAAAWRCGLDCILAT